MICVEKAADLSRKLMIFTRIMVIVTTILFVRAGYIISQEPAEELLVNGIPIENVK